MQKKGAILKAGMIEWWNGEVMEQRRMTPNPKRSAERGKIPEILKIGIRHYFHFKVSSCSMFSQTFPH